MARGGGNRGEVLIAVIGVTGAGKTTFISKATGRSDLVVGHGIDSCTQDITPVPFHLNGKAVTLIDTPGFDDSERTDGDILGLVAAYMAKTYEEGMLLHGIIFLQPINQPRLQGSEKRRTRLFKKLLGENAYERVVVATTMWNQVSESEGNQRQAERKTRQDVWGDMASRGARIVRHNDDRGSAINIISSLTNFSSPITLQIQEELVQNGGRVAATSAGKQLDEDLGKTIAKMRGEIEALVRERSNTADEVRELRAKVSQLERERSELEESNVWRILAGVARKMLVVGGTMALGCVIL